ncbi:hypothetical protein CHU93_03230 [Sandarakinorhabdus cyanobacteriorum]|uniref:Uncharacterized protein n=1 Tax=Sandarakinorhabdus cyanobacteriorum TaxID=1981098 RepID=A0A255YV73_9SPHN|nr:hypothetical protein [Sandarakinorhabdus cyanobacteriorum]OYQ33079.1 hypothetical protein CHU93_03230 [Sandarakinorhabdus cyanobacteriorum]
MPPTLLPALLPVLMLAAPGPTPVATPAEETIEVAAQRLTRPQIRAAALDYARAGLAPNPDYGQYARWRGPICVNVRGMPDPAMAARVAGRIEAVVRLAGLAIEKPGCKANLMVAFTDDARALVAQVRNRKRTALPPFEPRLFAALNSPSLPVRWWHVLGPAGSGGGAGSPDSGALASASSNAVPLGNVLPAGPNAVGTSSWNSSLVDTNLSAWARAGVAVVDVTLATGVSLDALADHVALVMVAPMRMPLGNPGVPSVLGLFTPGARPAGLTDWDRAFVKGLYRVQMNRSAQRQRQQLLSAMTAELAPGGETEAQ